MKFRFYLFKESNRVYDRSELITYLEAQPFMSLVSDGGVKIARYHNTQINMDAQFVLNTKSIVPDIQRLNPKYLDLNIYVEFDVLNNTYKVNKIVDLIENICKRFDFCVYNEYFEDVQPFKRALLIKAFELVKNGYKRKYEEEFLNYSRLDKERLDGVYEFLELKDNFEGLEEYNILHYCFLRLKESRNVYVTFDLDLSQPFIMPPHAQLVRICTENGVSIISYEDLKKKIYKYLKLVDAKLYDVFMVEAKHFKKVKKIILKSKFDTVKVNLKEVEFNSVLDI